jgi:hypothetical protein
VRFLLAAGRLDAANLEATIAICPGTYRFQNLLISQDVRLVGAGDGQGSGDTVVRGTGDGSVVKIVGGVVALEHLHITGGGGEGTSGGGLDNDTEGDTSLIGCTVSGNAASYGGGINNVGTLRLTDCTVSRNTAEFGSGGIDNSGTLILTRTKISGNTAIDGGGGGITNLSAEGYISFTDSVVNGNTAESDGGGIWNGTFASATFDADSRVTGNTAGIAGGIYNGAASPWLTAKT